MGQKLKELERTSDNINIRKHLYLPISNQDNKYRTKKMRERRKTSKKQSEPHQQGKISTTKREVGKTWIEEIIEAK